MGDVIQTHELSRAFASGPALDGLTLSVAAGEVLALLGPNGAGKTTTVRLLNGVLTPDSGWSRVLGFDPVAEGDEVRRRTGVLTENAGLDDRLTSRENLVFTARLRGFSAADSRRRADDLLARFGMADRADDLTQGFSTGQRKRVALARALLHDPEVLFLDEPTSGLDPAGTRDVIELIQSLAGEGRTIVLATHFLGEAGRLADRMAVLHRGELRAFGRPDDLAAQIWDGVAATIDLGRPADPSVLATIASVPGTAEVTATTGPARVGSDDVGQGATCRVADREVLPRIVAALAAHDVAVYQIVSHAPTLEDVYFELESRILAETGDRSLTDGFGRPHPPVPPPSDQAEVATGPEPEADDRAAVEPGPESAPMSQTREIPA
jgi:ABC-2 type transport system ATP-binding protein